MSDNPQIVLPEKLLDLGITYTNTHRRRLEAVGRFPKRVQISERKHGYLRAELLGWIQARIEARVTPRAA